jgi:Ser-tRNA(Ala) deacylase AlaX
MADIHIDDFKTNIPTHFKYPSIQDYDFTLSDKEEIIDKAKNLSNSNLPEIIQIVSMREFIGELARDSVNKRDNNTLPIIEWWD